MINTIKKTIRFRCVGRMLFSPKVKVLKFQSSMYPSRERSFLTNKTIFGLLVEFTGDHFHPDICIVSPESVQINAIVEDTSNRCGTYPDSNGAEITTGTLERNCISDNLHTRGLDGVELDEVNKSRIPGSFVPRFFPVSMFRCYSSFQPVDKHLVRLGLADPVES